MAIMKESETDQILYSNIFYLKQFMPNKMGGEVLILQNFSIPNSLRAYPIVQCLLAHTAVSAAFCISDLFQFHSDLIFSLGEEGWSGELLG